MEKFHQLLVRQVRTYAVHTWPDIVQRRAFLQAISDAYHQFDVQRRRMKKSLDSSSSELKQTNTEMSAFLQALPDQFFRLDATGRVFSYHPGSGTHHYLKHANPIAHVFYDIVDENPAEKFRAGIAEVLRSKDLHTFEFCDRNDKHYEARMFPLTDAQVLVLVRDISQRKYSEQRIAHLAYHDSLTGLPNRLLFKDRLVMHMAMAKRHGYMVAVLFIDLDRFKHINDTLGHSAGDHLLVTIAKRLRELLRSDEPRTKTEEAAFELPITIARMGGDEFTIILSEVNDVQTVVKVAKRILDVISKPVMLQKGEVFTTASIGIAVYPVDGMDFETLVKNADTAMYHAKERGRANYQLYTGSMNSAAVERLFLENSLHRAVERNELQVHFQPQQDLRTGAICSMEALLRWQHADVGYIGPDIFIPLAEESDLILKLGDWLVRDVCRQIHDWKKSGFAPCRVFLNISAQQFKNSALLPTLKAAMHEYDVASNLIGIELTETAIVQNPETTTRILHTIKGMGIDVSIDDFGTGYSSLSYLQSFPIDSLKIDQAFVRKITSDKNRGKLAGAIVALGHSLGLHVVAEGVENEEQFNFLKLHNCDVIQGYHVCPPRPAAEVERFLDRQSPAEIAAAEAAEAAREAERRRFLRSSDGPKPCPPKVDRVPAPMVTVSTTANGTGPTDATAPTWTDDGADPSNPSGGDS